MERHNGIEFDPEGAFVYYDDAQRALDAEREKVKEYMTNYVPLKALEDVEAQLATLQAQAKQLDRTLADVYQQRDGLQAQLRQGEGERDRAEGALIRAGFRKDCDIAACNCGPQWGHGGHASQRLREIADALPYQNGGVLLERIESLVREHTTLRQLVEEAASAPGKDWLGWQLKLGEALAAQDAGQGGLQ